MIIEIEIIEEVKILLLENDWSKPIEIYDDLFFDMTLGGILLINEDEYATLTSFGELIIDGLIEEIIADAQLN